MAFIDNTYFVGEITIPDIAGLNSNATALTQAIDQYEKEILISLLGYKLYSLLMADLDEDGKPQTEPYLSLVNGAEFDHVCDGETVLLKWNGLVNTDRQSLIAYYAYYKYVERQTTHLSGVGTILPGSEKGGRVSPVNKMINAWERMRELYGKLPPQTKRYYENYISCVAMYYPHDFNPSAYNYLLSNKESFPDWRFTPICGINIFGI